VMMVVLNPARGGEGHADGVAPRGRQGGGGAWGGGAWLSGNAVGRQRLEASGRGRRGHAMRPILIG
jgi:hypothetical protein